MANYNKSFNFRNGVQVDDKNLVVNANGLVGIGTSVPTEVLDVRGTAKVVGLLTAIEIDSPYLNVLGIATIKTANIGIVSITSGGIITATSSTGVVTYFGDGGRLLNLPTSQWVDVNSGLGFTSIYAQGFVGIATTMPHYPLQIGSSPNTGNGVGIDSIGGIVAAGIITANSFSGSGIGITSLNADNIGFGTLSNSRLPVINNDRLPANINISGIITAANGFFGTLSGIAATASSLPPTSDISIRSINTGFSTSGISTITSRLRINGTIGFNTDSPVSDFHLLKTTGTSLQLTSTTAESLILVGRSLSKTENIGGLRFGNADVQYPYSTQYSLDIVNYDVGNVNTYVNSGTTSGINTGNFNWIYGKNNSNPLMTLTYGGKLGIGITIPTNNLHVVGTSTVTGNSYVGGNLEVGNNLTAGGILIANGGISNVSISGTFTGSVLGNVYSTNGISTFYQIKSTSTASFIGNVGIGTTALTYPLQVNTGSNSFIINSFGGIGVGTNIIASSGNNPVLVDSSQGLGVFQGVGIGTTTPNCYIDFANAGAGVAGNLYRFMLPPKLTTTQRDNLTTIEGGLIYNITLHRLEFYNGSGWCGVATVP